MSADDARSLRSLPSIDRLLTAADELVSRYGRATVVTVLREVVDETRGQVRAGAPPPDEVALLRRATEAIEARWPAPPRRVVNATGVVVHTNLGRAPLAGAARRALEDAAGYTDLEYDVATGLRGSRTARLEPLLRDATGAEAAFAVNNAAAALVLALAALAAGRQVPVSRGELIEIGGSFRLPDIIAASGARLLEVGTTNRTRADDYRAGDDVGAILTMHPSNYRIVGFVERPRVPELAAVADDRGVPLLFDVGSGLLRPAGGPLADEPAVATALRDGADLVLCSGDKLLGGPQAGLLLGRADLIARCRRHPMARALRLDKLRIAALHATLRLHLTGRHDEIPVPAMLAADRAELEDRSRTLVRRLDGHEITAEVVDDAGVPGGGSAPDTRLDGPVVRIDVPAPSRVAARLRTGAPSVVVRIRDDAVLVDLRTVAPADDAEVVDALRAALVDRSQPTP